MFHEDVLVAQFINSLYILEPYCSFSCQQNPVKTLSPKRAKSGTNSGTSHPLNRKLLHSFESFKKANLATRLQVPEDLSLQDHRLEHLISHTDKLRPHPHTPCLL
jgi:hypothetical protein